MRGNISRTPRGHRRVMRAVAVLAVTVVAAGATTAARSDESVGRPPAEVLRAVEHQRLDALVQADMPEARRLHADDFQLINPAGLALSDEDYLGFIASGLVDYLVFEPESPIEVRVYGQSGVIRYQSHIEVVVFGELQSLDAWHTDLYERRHGQWQAVWSQATAIQ